MRLTWTLLTTFVLFVSVSSAQAFDRYYVIKITGFDGKRSYQVMSQDELKTFEKSLRAESRVFSKAYSEAKDEWQDAEETARITFPSLRPRRISKAGTYNERAKADEKLAYYHESAMEDAAEEKKELQMEFRRKKMSKEEQLEAKREFERRRSLEATAHEMVVSRINNMLKEQDITPVAQAAPTAAKKSHGKGKGGEVSATITGTIKKAGKSFYISANEGQLVNGLKPWGIDIPSNGIKDDMVGKQATITFTGTGAPRGDQIKVTQAKVSKMIIEGSTIIGGEDNAEKDPNAKKGAH